MANKQLSLHVVGLTVLVLLLSCFVNYSVSKQIKTYKLTRGKLSVTFTNYGAVMTSLLLPDRHGLFLSLPNLLSSLPIFWFRSDFVFLLMWFRKARWCCSWIWYCWCLQGNIFLIFSCYNFLVKNIYSVWIELDVRLKSTLLIVTSFNVFIY